MKDKMAEAFVLIFIGFIMLNVLASFFYRFNEVFNTTTNLYLWLALMIFAYAILLLGIKVHLSYYKMPIKISKY